MTFRRLLACFTLLFSLIGTVAAAAEPLPALQQRAGRPQMIVDGRPFLILGGELANSSSSSLDYMRPIWPRLRAMNLNTVLTPVSWELIEPEEGKFDFSIVDGLIRDAQAQDLRLVLLWFGSWKNSMSSYAPAWVKEDGKRFPRARTADGKAEEILSPFAPASTAADARAFKALMTHLAQADTQRTVIMVQVENEIGMIPDARDHSAPAEAAFRQSTPPAILSALRKGAMPEKMLADWRAAGARTTGSWADLFGPGKRTDEYFTAWHFGRYVEQIAAAGKSAYPLPLYVNAALPRPAKEPGDYPSAGPLPHLYEIWRLAAPSIDLLAPDIYYPNFSDWTDLYARPGNALFIPEANQAGASEAPANALYAIGQHAAIGFSPFSIDSLADPEHQRLRDAYAMLGELAPLIASTDVSAMAGARPRVAFDGNVQEEKTSLVLGRTRFQISFVDPWTPRDKQTIADHGGLILQLGPDDYLFAGSGITVTFEPSDGSSDVVGIGSIHEGHFVDGRWRPARLLNGDESHQGRHVRLPPDRFSIQRVHLYRYR